MKKAENDSDVPYPKDSYAKNQETSQFARPSFAIAFAIVWNAIIVATFYFLFRGVISEMTFFDLIMFWMCMIPLMSLIVAYVPFVQRVVFVADVDMPKLRPKLWALAAFWTLLVAFGFVMRYFFE